MSEKIAKLDKVESAYRQVYKVSNKDDVYQIVFIDDSIVLLRGKDSQRGREIFHRIETRYDFELQRDSGWFKLQPDSEMDLITDETEDWSNVDYIGESTKENLHENGFKGIVDVQMADDDELLDVGGLGNAGLENLREFAR
jgi:ERCC4-type nuclease